MEDKFNGREEDFFETMMEKAMFRSMSQQEEIEEEELTAQEEKSEELSELRASLEEEGIEPCEAVEVLVQLGMISPADMECLENYEKAAERLAQNRSFAEEE